MKTKQIITWVTGLEISLDLMQGMFISEDNFIISGKMVFRRKMRNLGSVIRVFIRHWT